MPVKSTTIATAGALKALLASIPDDTPVRGETIEGVFLPIEVVHDEDLMLNGKRVLVFETPEDETDELEDDSL